MIRKTITISFYSYKGGTGRSMLVAAAAKFLSESGKKVFLFDFDIEAPGLHHKFGKQNKDIRFDLLTFLTESAILIDESYGKISKKELFDWFINSFKALEVSKCTNSKDGQINLLPAGRAPEKDYISNLLKINWSGLFSKKLDTDGFSLFSVLKDLVIEKYKPDYILIDSRTGITDIGGIALNHMADKLVLLYINNKENLHGLKTLVEILDLDRIKENLFLINSRVPPQKVIDQKKRQNIDEAMGNKAMQECENIHIELKSGLENSYGAKHFTLHNESLLQLVERITYDPNLTPRDSALNVDNIKFFQSIFPDEFEDSPFSCLLPPLKENKDKKGQTKQDIDGDEKCVDLQEIIKKNFSEESKTNSTNIRDRIKKRHKSEKKNEDKEPKAVTCTYLPAQYINDTVYKDFVESIRNSIVEILNPNKNRSNDSKDLTKTTEKIPVEFYPSKLSFYNYDVLGIQMNSGLFDFSDEIYFKTETRSALLSVIKLAELKTYCIVAKSDYKDEISQMYKDFLPTYPEKHFIQKLYENGFNQFGLIASHAAAGECTKVIEKIGCPQNIVLKNSEGELSQWLQSSETSKKKIAFCDHKIGKNIADQNPSSFYCSTDKIDMEYHPSIDVGLIYPSGDIGWREVIVKAMSNVIKTKPHLWQKTDSEEKTIFEIFKEEHLQPLTLKELAENLLLDMPIKEGSDWLKIMQQHFPKETTT